jgi:hypothetical protein
MNDYCTFWCGPIYHRVATAYGEWCEEQVFGGGNPYRTGQQIAEAIEDMELTK